MNTLAQYFIPQWFSILFLILIPIPPIMVAFLARKGATEGMKNKSFNIVLLFLVGYFAYVTVLSFNGLFNKVSLPPMVLVYTTIPFAIFLFGGIMNLKIYKATLQNLKVEDLIAVHIFRLIGVFFLILSFYDTLPRFFALVAGLGDIITAIASIFVVNAIKTNKSYAKTLAYAWNTFGFVDILFTAISANVITKISIETGIMGVETLAQFPFCLIPAFAPPMIIFLHIAIYRKLKTSFS